MASHLRPGRAAGMMSVGIASRPAPEFFMEVLLTSTAVVALAEIGDKTQLLAMLLATRFRRPTPIILGILVATLANHAPAALPGTQAAAFLDSPIFRIAVGARSEGRRVGNARVMTCRARWWP